MLLQQTSTTDVRSGSDSAVAAESRSPFLETEKAFHVPLGGVTMDAHDREVLVGLTFEETVFYLTFIRAVGRVRERDVRERHRELRKRYEATRDGTGRL